MEHLVGDPSPSFLLYYLRYCCRKRYECVRRNPRPAFPAAFFIPPPQPLSPPPQRLTRAHILCLPPALPISSPCCPPPLPSESVTYGFFAIWTVLCCFAYSGLGTLILRNLDHRTPLAVGFMLGAGVVIVNMLLVLAVMSGEGPLCDGKPPSVRTAPSRCPSTLWLRHSHPSSFAPSSLALTTPPLASLFSLLLSQVAAVEAFSTMIMIAYAAFLAMTYQFRNTLLPSPMSALEENHGALPPAQGYGGDQGSQFAGSAGFTDASIGSSTLPGGVL